jgi:tRNA(fMet)-specific endonuclease VapC
LYQHHRGGRIALWSRPKGVRASCRAAAIDVLALETLVDSVYGELRARLERAGQSIGANDLLIAAHALTLGHTVVTDNEREFSRIVDLRIENWLR